MAVYTQVSAEALAGFLARYDVGELVSAKGIAEGVENSNYLVDTTRDRFILTLYEKRVAADDLPFFMALLDHLDAKGLAVPPAIKDREGREIQELEGRPACLIKFLTGVSLSTPTPAQALAAGQALSEMHHAVADFGQERANSMGKESWRPLFERCERDFTELCHEAINEAVGMAKVEPADFEQAFADGKDGARLTCGSSGVGAFSHLNCELFKSLTSLDVVHVPYRGAAPALVDLVGGQFDFIIENYPSPAKLIESGEVRRVGENEAFHVDVRIVCATNRDLQEMVTEGCCD